MKNNGHNHNFTPQILFDLRARAVPPAWRPHLLAWLRRTRRRPPRTFWLLDPLTGEWTLL